MFRHFVKCSSSTNDMAKLTLDLVCDWLAENHLDVLCARFEVCFSLNCFAFENYQYLCIMLKLKLFFHHVF